LSRFLSEHRIPCGHTFAYKYLAKRQDRFIQQGDRFFLIDAKTEPSAAVAPQHRPRRVGELKAAIRAVIEQLDAINSRNVHQCLKKQKFQFWAKKPNSSITNALRKLYAEGVLDLVRPVEGNQPAQYRKAMTARAMPLLRACASPTAP
jgi:hypothetical protein